MTWQKFKITEEVIHFWKFQFEADFVAAILENLKLVDIYEGEYLVHGLEVQGYMIIPKVRDQKVPAIIYSRGGYQDFGKISSYQLFYQFPKIALHGYAILLSQKQGNSFSEGKDTWGGENHFDDLLNLIEEAKKFEIINTTKVALLGMSRGGVEVYNILRNPPETIKAAITIGTTTDLIDLVEKRPEMQKVFNEAFGGSFTEMNKRSVSTFKNELSKNVPLLVLQGKQDDRNPPEQAEFLVNCAPNIEVKFVENGNHALNNWPDLERTILAFLKEAGMT